MPERGHYYRELIQKITCIKPRRITGKLPHCLVYLVLLPCISAKIVTEIHLRKLIRFFHFATWIAIFFQKKLIIYYRQTLLN